MNRDQVEVVDEGRTLLWSTEVEEGVLGCSIAGGLPGMSDAAKVQEAAQELVKEEWFAVPLHRDAWRVLTGMWTRREPVDLITFTQAALRDEELKKFDGLAGWATGLARLEFHGISRLEYYAAQLRDLYRRREVASICARLLHSAKDLSVGLEDAVDAAEAALLRLRTDGERSGLVHCASAVQEAAERIEAAHKKRGGVVGLATGFVDLDRMTGGLKGGQLVVIAARPSMGKSAFATNVAEHVCLAEGVPTALFSLEMTGAELMERVLCGQSGVKLQRVRDGFMSKEEMKVLGAKVAEVSGAALYVDETPALSIATFRARARRAVGRHGVKLVVVDYLQLMKGATKRAQMDRRLEIDEISAGLKATAKELNVPVIALSQLNRDAEERAEPKLSHLRESGSIEQDADVVALLHRPERVSHKEEDKGKAVLILAKQRNGPVGRIELYFDAEITRFRNITKKLVSNKKEERQGPQNAPSSSQP